DAVADERFDLGERLLDLAQVMEECSPAVNVQGCAVLLGEGADGDVFTMEDAIAIGKVVHEERISCRGVPGGWSRVVVGRKMGSSGALQGPLSFPPGDVSGIREMACPARE